MRKRLSINFEQWVDRNDRTIFTLQCWFTAGLGFLFIEIVSWIVQLLN